MSSSWPRINDINGLISRYSQDEARVLICALNMMHTSFKNIKKWRQNVDIFSGKLAISQSMSYTLHDYIVTAKEQGILPRQALLPVKYMDQRSVTPYSAGIIVLLPDPVNSSKFIICQVLNPADPVRNDVIETWGKRINKGGLNGLNSYIRDIKKKAKNAKMSTGGAKAMVDEITKEWRQGKKTYTSSIDGTEYLLRKKYQYNAGVPLTENPNPSLADPTNTNWPISIKVQMLVDHPDSDFPHLTAAGTEFDIDLNDAETRMIYLIPQSIDEELAQSSVLDVGNAGNGNFSAKNRWMGRVPKTSIQDIDFNKDTIKNWKGGMFQTLTRSILYGNYQRYGRIGAQRLLSVSMNDVYNRETNSWEGGADQTTITPVTCKQPCDKDSDFKHWCCSICGRQIPKSNLYRGYDVDHVFNLIFNTYFDINSDAIGFLNTCSDCNIWKSEKIWCPNQDVWEGLKAKARGGGDWPWNNSTPKEAWITGTVSGASFLPQVQGMTAKARSKKRCKNLSGYTLQDYYLNRLLAVLKNTTKGNAIVEACLSEDPLEIFRVEQDMESHYVNMALASLNLTSEANRLYDEFTREPATRSKYKGEGGKDLPLEQIKQIQEGRVDEIRQKLVNDIRTYQEQQKSRHQGSADFLHSPDHPTNVPVTVGTPNDQGTNRRVVGYLHGSQPTFGASPPESATSSQHISPKKDGSSLNPMEPIQEDWRIPETDGYDSNNYLWGNIDKLANEFLAEIYPDLKQYETIEYDQSKTQKHPPNCNVLNPKWFDTYFKKLHWAGYNGQKNSEIPDGIRNHKGNVKTWRQTALKAYGQFGSEVNTKRYLFLDAVQQCGRQYKGMKKFAERLTNTAPCGIPDPNNLKESLSHSMAAVPATAERTNTEQEIRILRNWYVEKLNAGTIHQQSRHLADENPEATEENEQGGNVHYWDIVLILSALNEFTPEFTRGQLPWTLQEEGNVIVYSNGGVRCEIRFRHGINPETEQKDAHFDHWTIAVGDGERHEMRIVPDRTDSHENLVVLHRNGGDCGPSAVALALRYVCSPHSFLSGLNQTERYNEMEKRRQLDLERQREQNRELERQLEEYKRKLAEAAAEAERLRQEAARKALDDGNDSEESEEIFNMEEDQASAVQMHPPGIMEMNRDSLGYDIEGEAETRVDDDDAETLVEDGGDDNDDDGPPSPRGRKGKRKRGQGQGQGGGKRTRKKRRKKKKTKRKRKYRKKTKGRKKRRKKRTRRKK